VRRDAREGNRVEDRDDFSRSNSWNTVFDSEPSFDHDG